MISLLGAIREVLRCDGLSLLLLRGALELVVLLLELLLKSARTCETMCIKSAANYVQARPASGQSSAGSVSACTRKASFHEYTPAS